MRSPRLTGARAPRSRMRPKTAALAAVFGVVLTTPQLAAAHAAPHDPGLPALPQSSVPAVVPAGKTPEPTVGPVTTDRITLITGDIAVVNRDSGGRTTATLQLAPGREALGYSTIQEANGDVSVLPSDVSALIAADLVDPQLFNVTKLIEYGYTDAARTELPVLTRREDKTKAAVPRGAKKNRSFDIIGVDAADVPKDKAADVWKELAGDPKDAAKRGNRKALGAGTRKISLDGKVKVSQGLDQSAAQINAPQMWQSGYTGTGVTVAVLDTGIDANHPDFQGKVAASKDFTGEGVADGNGHGTHVASIIAGSGAASAGLYKGVAPDAKLVVGKVMSNSGQGQWSWVMDGVKWAVEQGGAKIVNLSLGAPDTPGADDMENLVNGYALYRGTLFAIAAGNSGNSIDTPGSAVLALTVGAVDSSGAIAWFSGRGPVLGSRLAKPDVTAPGVDIVAARAAGTGIGSPVNANYTAVSGTSMATPHVAGAAALLLQAHPTWTGLQLRSALVASGRTNPSLRITDQGMGLVSVPAANAQKLGALWEAMIGFDYPHPQGQTATQDVQILNNTGQATTLNVQLQTFAADGSPAPAGALTLGATQLSLPADKSVSLTVAARGDVPVGTYYGYVTLTSPDGSYQTRFRVGSAVKPAEQNVTLSAPGTGTFASATATLFDRDGIKPSRALDWTASGWTGIVETGNYHLWASLRYSNLGVDRVTLIDVPVTVVAGQDVTLSWNLASAVPIDYRIDRTDAIAATSSGTMYYANNGVRAYAASTWLNHAGASQTLYVLPAQVPGLQFTGSRMLRQNVPGSPAYTANLVSRQTDGIAATQNATTPLANLALHRTTYRGQGAAALGEVMHQYADPATPGLALAVGLTTIAVPATVDEYYTPLATGVWTHNASVRSATMGNHNVWHPAEALTTPGDKGAVTFFGNVGPGMPQPTVQRTGNTLTLTGNTQLFSDTVRGTGYDTKAPPVITLDVDGVRKASVQVNYGTTSTWRIEVGNLPPASAEYTLTLSAARNVDYAVLATKVTAQWKFHSADAGSGTTSPDLSTVFFYLVDTTDNFGRVPANTQPWVIIGRSSPDQLAPYEAPQSLVVEASTNDGATWTVLPTTSSMFGPAVQLPVLAAGSYVSLRATWTRPNGDVTMTSVTRQFGVAA